LSSTERAISNTSMLRACCEIAGNEARTPRRLAAGAGRCKTRVPPMALEFALRPRINLERPTPSRRRRRSPRFALVVVAYWLAIAGGTTALLRVLKSPPGEAVAEAAEPNLAVAAEDAAEADDSVAANVDVSPPAAPAPALEAVAPPSPARDAEAEVPERFGPVAPHPSEPPRSSKAQSGQSAKRSEPRTLERTASSAPERSVRAEPRAEQRSEPPPPPLEAFELSASETASPTLRDEPVRPDAAPTSLPSCETAAASASETLDIGGAARAPDLPREAFAAVLDNGAYLARCALPARTTVEICAAVRDGKVVGVSASTTPRDPALNACVRRAVAGLRFPKSPHLDVTRTRFDRAR